MKCLYRCAALVSVLSLATGACSKGELSDAHDHYMNVFGIPLPVEPPTKGGFIGRALLAEGAPAAWGQVYTRAAGDTGGPPALTMTNEKGGFFLGNLEPAAYDVFVVSPAGQAVTRRITIAKGQVAEDDHVQLLPTARVSGRVTLADQPVATGTMVYVPGTPFSAFSDAGGAYYLDVPHGSFALRAEKDGFKAFESPALDFEGDRTLDIHLDENPWPNGQVSVVGSDGYLVRGLATTLKIEPVPGVRYMRIRPLYGALAAAPNVGAWTPVKTQVVLSHSQEGQSGVQVEFMDQYGKTSEPVQVAYYNTTLDASWTILYGKIDRPVVIAPGQKVALLGSYGGSVPYPSANGAAGSGTKPMPAPGPAGIGAHLAGTVLRSSDVPASAVAVSGDTVFTQLVTAGAGAHLQGSASFLGGLTLNGTQAQPVLWDDDQGSGSVYLQGPAVLHYATLKNLGLYAEGPATAVAIDHATLTGLSLIQSHYLSQDNEALSGSLTVTQSELRSVNVEQVCSAPGKLATAPAAPTGSMTLDLERNVLNQVTIHLGCQDLAPGFLAQVLFVHNNELDLADGLAYFSADGGPTLPDQTKIAYTVKDNYFQSPGRLYTTAGAAWPAFFAPSLATPWADAGVK